MKKLAIIIALCVLTLSGTAMAGNSGNGPTIPGGKWWRMPMLTQKLNVTVEEQGKLDSLFVQNRRQMIDLKSSVSKEVLELEEALDKKLFDDAECMDRFKKLQTARANLAAERFKYLLEVRKLLGNERYQQLKAKFQERRMYRMKGAKDRRRPAEKKEKAKTPE